ncbi:hypothetical protein [Bacillus thuringiensis]|uniref:hypothetical protein n=1 Tax=Bacillus thuringiensis TaxID=1428 RepID=UPI0011A8290A|nr:hypothetical protein [Bacillus thuringiensis]
MDFAKWKMDAWNVVKSYMIRHWFVISISVMLLLSIWLYRFTYSSFLAVVIFGLTWILAAFCYNKNVDESPVKFRKKKEKHMMYTVLRVYTNDEYFKEHMENEEYFHSQVVRMENRLLDMKQDLSMQIPYYPYEVFAYCYHFLLDQDNEIYLIAEYSEECIGC